MERGRIVQSIIGHLGVMISFITRLIKASFLYQTKAKAHLSPVMQTQLKMAPSVLWIYCLILNMR